MKALPSRTLVVALAGVLAATALLAIPSRGDAYARIGNKWSKGKITYYNGVKGYDPAVKAAVSAWNHSGAKVKFVRTSKKKARVRIRYMRDNTCRGLTRLPTRKITTHATVYLPAPGSSDFCRDTLTMAIVAAHEFGHVLGLAHETRGCALMNPEGSRAGGSLCAEAGGTPPWLWRCRVLEPDDVRGAIKIYGGKYRASKFTANPLCAFYPAPPAPTITSTSGTGGALKVSILRPADGVVPPYVLSEFPGGTPFTYVAYAAGACPAITSATKIGWGSIAVGQQGTSQLATGLAPGSYCVSVWAADAVGQPSVPATTTVQVS